MNHSPLILAPAGKRTSFLAAIAAGADAVYCGLKTFSARMEAKNFHMHELAELTELAHSHGVNVFVTVNSMILPDELEAVGKTFDTLHRHIHPDGLIIQDPGLIQIARDTGFSGKIHLSTLANVDFPDALPQIWKEHGVKWVVVPRELDIDEIKSMAEACPKEMGIEVFVHGALCYGISGRCYWSSFLGGKSGLRGRCVQPCRRMYLSQSRKQRYFSCQDLSLDVLAKVLRKIPQIKAWKIEGRKKGPHYVYFTVQAYKLFRDHGDDPAMKKTAIELLKRSLGRPGTHYFFLPQRPQHPVQTNENTGSGLLIGRIKGGKRSPFVHPREDIFPGDTLRIGYEDEKWHASYRVGNFTPKKGKLNVKPGTAGISIGAPVFLTDRFDPELKKLVSNIDRYRKTPAPEPFPPSKFSLKRGRRKNSMNLRITRMRVERTIGRTPFTDATGLWVSKENVVRVKKKSASKIWWWLPPFIGPKDQDRFAALILRILDHGGKKFILNSPWQKALFKKKITERIWAGPFCNVANPAALDILAEKGFHGIIVSPELGKKDFAELAASSPIPLGVVTSGIWPFCVSRIHPQEISPHIPFESPKGESAWFSTYDNATWVFPNWEIDITEKEPELRKMGYSMFVTLEEKVPPKIKMKNRPGKWNWDIGVS